MIASCQVKHWSKTQSTIALSSGEAELSGIGSGMAQALVVESLCADMGWQLKPDCTPTLLRRSESQSAEDLAGSGISIAPTCGCKRKFVMAISNY